MLNNDNKAIMIKDMHPDERPRERLERYGPGALSVPELIAIILRVGNAQQSAVQMGQMMVRDFGNLRSLADASITQLSKVKGIGLAKACQLKAAFELGKRLATSGDTLRPVMETPQDAVDLLMEEMRYLKVEHFRVLFLNTRHEVMQNNVISIGTLNSSLVHPRETFSAAISYSSAAIILAHNHPSGDPSPSHEDLVINTRMVQSGALLGIPVLDHIIIGDGRFVSLKEQGLMGS